MKITKRNSRVQPLKATGTAFSSDKVTPVIEFLKANYRIEVNKYDRTQMRIASTGTRAYTFPPSLDDISIHLMQSGIPHTKSLIRMLLNSPNQIASYDPVKEYFASLREIEPDGESHIDRLIAHLRVREFDDRPEGYYREMAARFIRKWLAAAAACAIGESANEAALVFVSATEGNGKTSLAKFLCPEPLREMMTLSHADRRVFNIDQAVTSNFLVLYDEMHGLSASTAEEFKKVLSARSLPVKLRGEFGPVVRPRIASVVATTNNRTGFKSGFLCPALGTRRFISIYLDSIDFGYAEEVDVDRLWAEALALAESPDYDHRYTQEEFAELKEANQRYMIETPASAVLQQAFTLPEGEEDAAAQWLTPTEILAELQRRRMVRTEVARYMTPKHLGEALTALGFRRDMVYGAGERRYKYRVRTL